MHTTQGHLSSNSDLDVESLWPWTVTICCVPYVTASQRGLPHMHLSDGFCPREVKANRESC